MSRLSSWHTPGIAPPAPGEGGSLAGGPAPAKCGNGGGCPCPQAPRPGQAKLLRLSVYTLSSRASAKKFRNARRHGSDKVHMLRRYGFGSLVALAGRYPGYPAHHPLEGSGEVGDVSATHQLGHLVHLDVHVAQQLHGRKMSGNLKRCSPSSF